MAKLKNPLLSLTASGPLSRVLSFVRRKHVSIAEKKPELKDAHSEAQLSWRTMFEQCTALWHTLTTAEKATWEKLARPRHMTGYALWQSQCLRPNPGIYLPLAGGTMTGEIAMSTKKITGLGDPGASQDADTKAGRDGAILTHKGDASAHHIRYTDTEAIAAAKTDPTLLNYTQGARVYNSADQSIANNAWVPLTFDSERYDTDGIHSTVSNTHVLTCKTAGIYLISACLWFEANATGVRQARVLLNGVTTIAPSDVGKSSDNYWGTTITTVYKLAIGDYVESDVYQDSGGALKVMAWPNHSPEFMMQRIG